MPSFSPLASQKIPVVYVLFVPYVPSLRADSGLQPGKKPSRRVNLCSPAGLKIFGSGGRDRTADKRIMIPQKSEANTLDSSNLQVTPGLAPNSAPNSSPENTQNPAPEATPTAPNADSILDAFKDMSDTERGKLLAALLGLVDGHK